MKNIIAIFTVIVLSLGFSNSTFAQCQKYAKKQCVPELAPFIYNGQMNSAVLNEGDIAELVLTFYKNQKYRVLICGEEQLGNISFKLKDTKDNVLFDNSIHDFAKSWDFTSNTTQQIVVEVEVPESDNPEDAKSGCVSILVGFKDVK